MPTTLEDLEQLISLQTGAIDSLVTNGFLLAALQLTYSAIDVVSAMEVSTKTSVKARYTAWLENYMAPEMLVLQVTAMDVYGARCGLLHEYSSESDLSNDGKAVQFVYLDQVSGFSYWNMLAEYPPGLRPIYIQHVIQAFKIACNRFCSRVQRDSLLEATVKRNIDRTFIT